MLWIQALNEIIRFVNYIADKHTRNDI